MSLRKTLSIRRKPVPKLSFDSGDVNGSDCEPPLPPLPPLARLSSFVDASLSKFKRFGKSSNDTPDDVTETNSVDSAPEEFVSLSRSPDYDPVEAWKNRQATLMHQRDSLKRRNSFSSLYTVDQDATSPRHGHYESDATEEHITTLDKPVKDMTSSRSQVLSDSDVSNDLTLSEGLPMKKDNSVRSFLDSKDGQEKMQEIMKVITHQEDFVNVDGTRTEAHEAYDTMLDRLLSVWNMRITEMIPSTA